MSNYYEILGVEKSANADEIKKAYRKLTKKYHPDVNQEPGAVEKFKEVNEAYECLSDTKKRQNYDQFGTTKVPTGGFDPFAAGFSSFDFFGGNNRENLDIHQLETISFKESILGCKRTISVPSQELCKKCSGVGYMDSESCRTCSGSGIVVQQQGGWRFQTTCPTCQGQGKKLTNKCTECQDGRIDKISEEIEVKIPAGIFDQNAIRLSGKGLIGKNGKKGHLYLVIKVMPHEFLKREGLNLHCDVPVSYTQLILGGEVIIPSIEGTISVKIPPNSSIGTKLKLKNQGVKVVANEQHTSGQGDLYLHLNCPTSKNLPEEYVNKLKELAELETKYPANEVKIFREKMVNYE